MQEPQFAKSCLASGGATARPPPRRIIGENRADHEGRSTAADDGKRYPIHLAIERKPDQLDRMSERIELAYVIEHRAAFLHPPERIKGRRSKEHRKDHEVHDA